MGASAKKARRAVVAGAEHTDASLAAMKTGEVAALVAAIKGGNPPKPATKAKAIELFWKAAASIPEPPKASKESPKEEAMAEAPNATEAPRNSAKAASAKAPSVKVYAVRVEGQEAAAAVQAMTPQVRGLVEAMRAAGRPLAMAECAALLGGKSKRPDKVVAWYFARVLRPAGVLVESREGRGA